MALAGRSPKKRIPKEMNGSGEDNMERFEYASNRDGAQTQKRKTEEDGDTNEQKKARNQLNGRTSEEQSEMAKTIEKLMKTMVVEMSHQIFEI
ncbi:unnamed protein product [Allacma fusca]|uniref:Uncharacterized protein n=1 Tax=Allacma fusca TaxID=39272 RepID=A0A8J2PMQ8_9HEXA|nr:unnamed protein product [Allacma fusca]